MPELDREQRRIVRLIRREGRNIRDPRTRRVYERAAVQTGLVESGLRNLTYGDADSQGWRQERASLYPDPTNLRASIRRFREEFEQHYSPGERSYDVAAQVQRPAEQYRGRYRDVKGQAARILRQVGGGLPAPGPAYETIPGVDRSAERDAVMRSYFFDGSGQGDLLALKQGLDSAQDTPSRRVRVRSPRSQPNRTAGGETSIGAIIREAERRGLTVGEHPSRGGVDPVHTEGSWHYKGAAADITGDPRELARFKRWLRKRHGRDLEELIFNAGGGRNLKNGRRVGPGFYSGHTTHLHVADDDR